MNIENELISFLELNIEDGPNKSRDIEIIKFYYGLNEFPWPTLEETASRFSIGTRERIRQLLKSKFRDHVSRSDIPSINVFVNTLRSREYWLISQFEKEVYAENLIDEKTHLKGVFNLIEDINIDSGFEFYTTDLNRATRNSFKAGKNAFLIKTSKIEYIRKLFKKAQNLPGRCGIANLNYIREELGEYYQLVSSLIESSPTSWIGVEGDDFWYIFENRDNTIINYSEKVFLVIDCCDAARLAEAFRNALDGRTYQYPYPPPEIIREYLKSSVYFANSDLGLKFIGETTKLSEIEEDIVSFFDSRSVATFTDINEDLSRKNYGRPYIIKATNYSPLVFVDRSRGKKHHLYSLISQKKLEQDCMSVFNTYEIYLRRLRSLLNYGTDETREQAERREQYILQEWLFKDKTHENCAICGREFSVQTLVAARKKPRSDCNNAEKLDPYIVMPLCLMGCDYLYENVYVYVGGNEVRRGLEFPYAGSELAFIDKIVGRKVDSKWLLGGQSYFRSPDKALQRTGR